jgi:hypothetical protein
MSLLIQIGLSFHMTAWPLEFEDDLNGRRQLSSDTQYNRTQDLLVQSVSLGFCYP